MGALQYFVPVGNDGEMRQEIWLYMNYNDDNFVKQGGSNLVFCRYKSNYLKYVRTEEELVGDQFRALIGVVEGAPPYIRNGSQSNEYGSTFHYGRSLSNQMSVSTKFTMGAYVKAGTSLPIGAELGLKFTTEHAETSTENIEITKLIDKSIVPIAGENSVTYFYLKPHVVKRTFEQYDWSKKRTLGIETYLFHAASAEIDFDVMDILHTYEKNPNSHDYKTFLHRIPAMPHYVDQKKSLSLDVSWVPGRSSAFFQKRTTEVKIASSKVSVELNEGIYSIFEMGGNTTYEYEISHASDVSEKVGVELDFPHPRADFPEDIKKMVLRMYILVPDEGNIESCYWIPKDHQNQRPWCVAWSIQGLKHQNPELD